MSQSSTYNIPKDTDGTLSSNSDFLIPSQKAVKTYADTKQGLLVNSAGLAAALNDETGTGSAVFSNAPTLTNPVVGTQTAGDNSTKAASTAYVDAINRYTLHIIAAPSTAFNPADGTTYYFGPVVQAGAGATTAIVFTTSANTRYGTIPYTGTLVAAVVELANIAGAGTTEASTLYFRLNNTTDVAIATLNNNAAAANNTYYTTGLSQAVTAGNTWEMKWITPTWGTNPTGVTFAVTLIFK